MSKEEREIIEGLAWQYGNRIVVDGIPMLSHGYISAMERAFDYLGWGDYKECPEMRCEYKGCNKWQSSGTPTKDGYKRVCGEHFSVLQKEKEELI